MGRKINAECDEGGGGGGDNDGTLQGDEQGVAGVEPVTSSQLCIASLCVLVASSAVLYLCCFTVCGVFACVHVYERHRVLLYRE